MTVLTVEVLLLCMTPDLEEEGGRGRERGREREREGGKEGGRGVRQGGREGGREGDV